MQTLATTILLSLMALVVGPTQQRPSDEVGTGRRQVLLDVKVVTYRVAPPAEPGASIARGLRVLDPAAVGPILRQLMEDPDASFLQIPRIVAEDDRQAVLQIGPSADREEVDVRIVTRLLDDARSMTLDVDARLGGADAETRSTFLALRIGQTAVVFHDCTAAGMETVLFVTPSPIATPASR